MDLKPISNDLRASINLYGELKNSIRNRFDKIILENYNDDLEKLSELMRI